MKYNFFILNREPPRVLKPKHLSDEQSRSWRPMIGMTHSNQRGRLATSGHRALSYVGIFISFCLNSKNNFVFRHYVPRNASNIPRNSSNYGSVPPPQSNCYCFLLNLSALFC